MGDQKKDNDGNRHIRGRGVWIPTDLPKDLQDLIVKATSAFFDEQKQKGSSIEQTEKAAKLYLSAFDVKEGDPEIMAIMRDTIQAMIDDGLQLMRTAAILDELQPYIEAELKRPEYDGFDTLHDILEAYHNSEGGASYLERMYQRAMYNAQLSWEIDQLQPYIDEELKKPKYKGKSLQQLRQEATNEDMLVVTGWEIIPGSLFQQMLDNAREAAAIAKTAIKRAQTVEYPLDKPNSIIWSLLEKDTKGQISFNLAKVGSSKQIPAYYAINFDDLGSDIQITKRLLPTDKRVYIAISALYNAGNNVITLTQIYYAMGYTGRPGTKDLARINESITKMTSAKIFFDNKAEAEAYKNFTRFKYDGSLLPLERGTAIVNGQLADAAIHIFREPPLISFAKQRRQITSLDVKLLQSPVSKTDANLQIEDYLIERISRAKNGKGKSCRILFETLYRHTGITTKKQKQRAPAKIEKYLQYYKEQTFLKDYTIENDGITLYWK